MRSGLDQTLLAADLGFRVTFLGLAQNLANDALATTPKSLVLRARAYRVLDRIFRHTHSFHNVRNAQDL